MLCEYLKSLFFNKKVYKNVKAYTIAEILTVLSVLAVLFMLVVPYGVTKYKKFVTAKKVAKFYSVMKTAVESSVYKYGPFKYWVYDAK